MDHLAWRHAGSGSCGTDTPDRGSPALCSRFIRDDMFIRAGTRPGRFQPLGPCPASSSSCARVGGCCDRTSEPQSQSLVPPFLHSTTSSTLLWPCIAHTLHIYTSLILLHTLPPTPSGSHRHYDGSRPIHIARHRQSRPRILHPLVLAQLPRHARPIDPPAGGKPLRRGESTTQPAIALRTGVLGRGRSGSRGLCESPAEPR